jgi:hypothetical protein
MFCKIDTARWCRTYVTNIFYSWVLLKKMRIPINFLETLNNTKNVVKQINTSGQRYSLGW